MAIENKWVRYDSEGKITHICQNRSPQYEEVELPEDHPDIILFKNPPKNYQQLREAEYPVQKDILVALWEKVIEGRSELADTLQAQRLAVKAKYPKPA